VAAHKSELEAALEEDFAWRYIRMPAIPPARNFLQNFQYFATEIEPKMAPYSNELNKKLVASEWVNKLDGEKYLSFYVLLKKRFETVQGR